MSGCSNGRSEGIGIVTFIAITSCLKDGLKSKEGLNEINQNRSQSGNVVDTQ